MQDGEEPGADVAVAPLVPAADGALQAILNQIVGVRAIANQCSGIAAERGYQRFDLQQHVFHDALPPAACLTLPLLSLHLYGLSERRRISGGNDQIALLRACGFLDD